MSLDDDIHLVGVTLPIEQQQCITLENRLEFIQKTRDIARGVYVPNIIKDEPLSTDTYKRGYPATKDEIEVVRKINEHEEQLLQSNKDIKPSDNADYKYYIVENGIIFKSIKIKSVKNNIPYVTACLSYVLDTSNMKWNRFDKIWVKVFKEKLRVSELVNFRDYYDCEE